MIRRAVVGGFAAALLLIALRAAPIAANPAHHPAEGAASGTGTPGIVPDAPMDAPAAPGPAPATPTAVPATSSGTPGMPPGASMTAPGAPAGGMGGMMGEMMAPASPGSAATAGPSAAAGCMGGNCGSGAAKTPIYPSLMTLPALTPEKRVEIDLLATQQINEGIGRHATGSTLLDRATQAGDYAAMQRSVSMMRQGLDELGAGIAARRVLSEGKSPRNLALDWFRREMNLASPILRDEPRALLGVAPLHLFAMGLLVAFALAMVVMYFFKMRRATALFGRIEPASTAPPSGTSPPLAGAPSPSPPTAPSAGNAAPSGVTQPPSAASTPGSLTVSQAEKSPTLDPSHLSRIEASPVLVPEVTSASPVTQNWRGQLRVGSIVTETPSVKTFRLLPSSGDNRLPFTFVPGQFLNVTFSIGGARMNRSYSISSSPTEREYVDLTVRREPRGAVSRHIVDLLKVGDQVQTAGPVGRFTFTGTEADSIVLIAGGVGITPMMSIARYLTERSWAGDIFFVYACRAPSDFIFANAVAALQRRNPKLRVSVTMERPEGTDWKGPRGRVTKEFLTQMIPDLALRRIHLCGPPLMMDAIKAVLVELGVPTQSLKTEAFGTPKPPPAAAGTTARAVSPATGPLVTFSKNRKSSKIHIDQSILELSEELAIGIEYSCRVGTCGVCKVKLASGEVEMAIEDALEPEDKANGIILACQAKPTSDVVVEA